jgi:hypothetical protein
VLRVEADWLAAAPQRAQVERAQVEGTQAERRLARAPDPPLRALQATPFSTPRPTLGRVNSLAVEWSVQRLPDVCTLYARKFLPDTACQLARFFQSCEGLGLNRTCVPPAALV